MSRDLKKEIRELRATAAKTGGQPYVNIKTGKIWYLMSSVLIGGVYTGYIRYFLCDETGKYTSIIDERFSKFYERCER